MSNICCLTGKYKNFIIVIYMDNNNPINPNPSPINPVTNPIANPVNNPLDNLEDAVAAAQSVAQNVASQPSQGAPSVTPLTPPVSSFSSQATIDPPETPASILVNEITASLEKYKASQ